MKPTLQCTDKIINCVVLNCFLDPLYMIWSPWPHVMVKEKTKANIFGENTIFTFCSCFRVIYNLNLNWRLHPLNERAIGAMMPQMIDRDINFHILPKKIKSQVYFSLRLWVANSIYRDMAAMTAEQWQFCQLVAKTLHETADIDRMRQRASVCLAFQDQPRRMTANEVLHIQDFPDVTLVFKDDRLLGGISLH